MEKRMDGLRKIAVVSTCSILLIATIYCIFNVRTQNLVSDALVQGDDTGEGDVKDQIENDSASHLLIKNDVRVAVKLSSEAEKTYIRTDSRKAREQSALQSALHLENEGEKEMNEANKLKQESLALVTKSQKLQDEFNKQENWAEKEQQLSQQASKDYRHDVLRLAEDVSKISELRAAGKTVPSALTAQVKNITHQMALDSQRSKEGYTDLSKKAVMRSQSLPDASGRNAPALAVPATSWSLDQQSQKERARAKKLIAAAQSKISAIRAEEHALKKPFLESECLEK
jgi:hypothetical protein